jgi:hypothetical protein
MNQEEVNRLEAEWKAREREWRMIQDLYFSSGSSPVEVPARDLTPQALEEVETAKRAEEEAFQRYIDSLGRL